MPRTTTANRAVTGRKSSERSSRRPYQSVTCVKVRSIRSAKRPCEPCPLRINEHIIGDSVRATTPEMITAPARVKANSRKSEPVRPVRKPMGA